MVVFLTLPSYHSLNERQQQSSYDKDLRAVGPWAPKLPPKRPQRGAGFFMAKLHEIFLLPYRDCAVIVANRKNSVLPRGNQVFIVLDIYYVVRSCGFNFRPDLSLYGN